MGMGICPIELGNDALELDRFRDIELNRCRVMGAQETSDNWIPTTIKEANRVLAFMEQALFCASSCPTL
jgi:hypothetical protein